ncbi:DUF4372 domain-containing protein [Prevotella herbatica]|uniref:DUF4372 domain-containing protein n=1 Tax=Prevotella herbatica TaxID=2801997 RepID=UPI001F342C95|nr:DUF4372 domain-containing protein [Prevotella herbatica]
MGKSTHSIGLPLYSQVINLHDKSKFLRLVVNIAVNEIFKRFDGLTHLVVMLYAVIMRFNSLREINTSLQAKGSKFHHLSTMMKSRNTLSDANRRSLKLCLRQYTVIYMPI